MFPVLYTALYALKTVDLEKQMKYLKNNQYIVFPYLPQSNKTNC